MIIGSRVKNLRCIRGLNQSELGNIIGVSKASISGYEHATRNPSYKNLEKIADFFGVTSDYLLGREELIVYEKDNPMNINKEDVNIINSIKDYPSLYDCIKDNPKRYFSYLDKRYK
jgi:transcriptional regulator with XRE-family HTH domain